jgi:3-oxoacyl-[acyl-carrier-protein] synthase III
MTTSRPSQALLRAAGVLATGAYLPERRVTNAELEGQTFLSSTGAEFQIPAGEIESRTGIQERRWSEEPCSVLAGRAGADCLARAGVDPTSLDLVLVASSTPDHSIPKMAPRVAELCGASGIAAWDAGKDCTGFVEALDIATNLVATGSRDQVLVIGAERMTAIVSPTNKATAVVFGDGAGAALIGPVSEGRGWIGAKGGSAGAEAEKLFVPVGGSAGGLGLGLVKNADPRERSLYMNGGAVFAFAKDTIPRAIADVCEQAGVAIDDIRLLIPHQSNRRILDGAMDALGWARDDKRLVVNLDRFGNTAAASVAIAMNEAARAGRMKPGDLVCLVAYGAGISWTAALLRW